MKKFIIAIFAIGAISFSSCKKEYDCTCTQPDAETLVSLTEVKAKGKDAKDACDDESKPLQLKVCIPTEDFKKSLTTEE